MIPSLVFCFSTLPFRNIFSPTSSPSPSHQSIANPLETHMHLYIYIYMYVSISLSLYKTNTHIDLIYVCMDGCMHVCATLNIIINITL